jgi:hypothetical protein
MVPFRSPLHSRQHRLQRIHCSAQFVPVAPRRLFSSLIGSRRHGEAFPCNCVDFFFQNCSWTHGRYSPPAGRVIPGPAPALKLSGRSCCFCSSVPAQHKRIPGNPDHGKSAKISSRRNVQRQLPHWWLNGPCDRKWWTRGEGWAICCPGTIFSDYATFSATSRHCSFFPMVCASTSRYF